MQPQDKCPKCGSNVNPNVHFCGKCGQNLQITCENCGSGSKGKLYEFYYGTLIHDNINDFNLAWPGDKTGNVYGIKGKASAFICDSCVSKKRNNAIMSILGLFCFSFLLFAFAALSIPNAYTPISIITLIAVFAGIGTISIGIYRPGGTLKGYQESGNRIALNCKKNLFTNQGYNQFWIPRQYSKLHLGDMPGTMKN